MLTLSTYERMLMLTLATFTLPCDQRTKGGRYEDDDENPVAVRREAHGGRDPDDSTAWRHTHRIARRPAPDHGRACMDETGKVCRVDCDLHVHPRLGIHVPSRVAQNAPCR